MERVEGQSSETLNRHLSSKELTSRQIRINRLVVAAGIVPFGRRSWISLHSLARLGECQPGEVRRRCAFPLLAPQLLKALGPCLGLGQLAESLRRWLEGPNAYLRDVGKGAALILSPGDGWHGQLGSPRPSANWCLRKVASSLSISASRVATAL